MSPSVWILLYLVSVESAMQPSYPDAYLIKTVEY